MRRIGLVLVASLILGPLAAIGQQRPGKIPHVGVLAIATSLPEDWNQQAGGAPREASSSFCSSSEGWRPKGSIVPRYETGRRV
jgi:hypothetical protein